MVTHLQETWKVLNKVTSSSTIYYNYFKVDKLRFLVGSFNIKLSKINNRKVEGYSRTENTMNQFNVIKIYTIFTQQQDTNSIQVPIDYKPRSNSSFHVL